MAKIAEKPQAKEEISLIQEEININNQERSFAEGGNQNNTNI